MDTKAKPRSVLTRLNELGRSTDRCVSAAALRAAGISADQARSLARRGAITPVFREVYVVGDVILSARQLMHAGLLAGGPASMLTGRTAAEHLGLLPATNHTCSVLVPEHQKRRTLETRVQLGDTGRSGLITCTPTRWLEEATLEDGMAVAPIGRVLVDLAAHEGGDVAWRAWKEADFLRRLDHASIEAACGRGRAGTSIIRALSEALPVVQTDETDAQTKAEYALIEALLRRGVARPESNAPMLLDQSWYFPDLWWRLLMAVVEVDGPIHSRPRRRAQDRARDAHMAAHRIRVFRVDRDAVLADADREARTVAAWLGHDGTRR